MEKRLEIVPYVYNDGSWNFSDRFIESLFVRAYQEGFGETVFCDGMFSLPSEFRRHLQSPGVAGYLLFWDGQVCSMNWLDTFSARAAVSHYFPLDTAGFRNPVKIGRAFLDFVFSLKMPSDKTTYCLDMLTGLTLVSNIAARKFLKLTGWKEGCILPCGIYHKKEGKSGPAVLSYVTRGGFADEGL